MCSIAPLSQMPSSPMPDSRAFWKRAGTPVAFSSLSFTSLSVSDRSMSTRTSEPRGRRCVIISTCSQLSHNSHTIHAILTLITTRPIGRRRACIDDSFRTRQADSALPSSKEFPRRLIAALRRRRLRSSNSHVASSHTFQSCALYVNVSLSVMDGLGRSDVFGHGRSSPCARESASRIESSFRRSIAINRDDNDVAIEKTATSTGSCRHFVAPPQSTPLRCPTTTKMRIVTRHHPQRRGIWLPNSSARFATSSFTNPSSVRPFGRSCLDVPEQHVVSFRNVRTRLLQVLL